MWYGCSCSGGWFGFGFAFAIAFGFGCECGFRFDGELRLSKPAKILDFQFPPNMVLVLKLLLEFPIPIP